LIEGDGIGRTIGKIPGISRLAVKVLDEAVRIAYQGKRNIHWFKTYAGDEAREYYNPKVTDADIQKLSPNEQRSLYLPEDTIKAIRHFKIVLKGPLTTPIGGGFRSINVGLRQLFDLYTTMRPVRYFKGVKAPNVDADKVDMVVFRENIEDVYAGIEFQAGSPQAEKLIEEARKLGADVLEGSAIGLKPISEFRSKRLIRRALQYAVDQKRRSVTLMHKGNIMKYTEGAFRDWGYELAREEFSEKTVTEDEVSSQYGGKTPQDKILVNDRIADSMFQQIQTRPGEYSVIATTNLNGDYLSDAIAALVGGLGLAPSANLGDEIAIFEASHGTAPKYAGRDMSNPSSIVLSGALMLEHMGWKEAAKLVQEGIARTIEESATEASQGPGRRLYLTYDLVRQYPGYTEEDAAPSSLYTDRIIYYMDQLATTEVKTSY
jgi:isocitrate dehydrogenase